MLERNPYIGGATVSRELHEGWWYSNCSYVSSLLRRPEIARDLELPRHGLTGRSHSAAVATFMRNGDHFGNYSDPGRHYREMARHSRRDANGLRPLCQADTSLQTRTDSALPHVEDAAGPDLDEAARSAATLLEFARSFMALGEDKLLDTIKFWTGERGRLPARVFRNRRDQGAAWPAAGS